MPCSAAALAILALLAGAPSASPALSRGSPRRAPDLTLHLGAGALHDAGLEVAGGQGRETAPPPCLGDVCQPVVAVPGFEPRYGRVHRSELFVLALERAHVEPLASVARALVATGLRLDWSPPVFDGRNVDGRGWGSLTLRLRVRIDATNRLVFPTHAS